MKAFGCRARTASDSENRVGWTVGAGVERAIWNNSSVKAEYDYLDFGDRTVAINGTVLPGTVNFPASFAWRTRNTSTNSRQV
jgi:opacity protein-like surface antigen